MLRPRKYFCAARVVQNQAAHHDLANWKTQIGSWRKHLQASPWGTSCGNSYARRQNSFRLLRRLLWLRIVFHLRGILDKDHGFPDVVVRENAIPTGHGGVTNAVLNHI